MEEVKRYCPAYSNGRGLWMEEVDASRATEEGHYYTAAGYAAFKAQLEAAKLRLGYYAEGHDLTAQPSMKSIEEIVAQSVKDGENEYISVPARWLHKKLTAQPDGVRASLWEQLAKCRGRIMDKQSADITCCFDQPDCEDHAEEKRLIQALAAPAPAYDPKPDWRCKACEETGMRHCSEPERCGNMKPPAPAKERCALCGISRENHDVIINGQPHPYAPACKTCGGYQEVKKMVGPTFEQWQPCPDCAKET